MLRCIKSAAPGAPFQANAAAWWARWSSMTLAMK
jgi:hypothetical protein